ncbi:hypothetical protein FHS15_004114 [Paenibacillus castaneae]|uniref:copper amine oxidase N-terminal domain-containing protein n=1 Tax=Paenibacillus castaneae TaxID=474957 RepID=UPI000C9A5B50|nr:copper amine oxidase N-terminal domain-containing protein [Paenibacillus castaneae]NIK78968.1 hypothetical protein [Paenibacillus castaneae]
MRWLKGALSLLSIMGMLVSGATVAAAPQTSLKVYIDGKRQENVLQVNGRTMVQLKAYNDPEKLTYTYEASSKSVVIQYTEKNRIVRLKEGASTAEVNGKSVKLDAPAIIKEGRTYLPLRFLAETLGGAVTYNKDTNQVIVRTPSGQENYKVLMSGDLDKAREAALRIPNIFNDKEIAASGEGFTFTYVFPKGEALRYQIQYKQLVRYVEINGDGLSIVKWQRDNTGKNGESGKEPAKLNEAVFYEDNLMLEKYSYGTIDSKGVRTEMGVVDYNVYKEYKGTLIVAIDGEQRIDRK